MEMRVDRSSNEVHVNHASSKDVALVQCIGIGIGIYLGCFLPGGNSAHNTIIITKPRYSHQKITHVNSVPSRFFAPRRDLLRKKFGVRRSHPKIM